MTLGSVNTFDIKEGTTLSEIYKGNLEHAKSILLEVTNPQCVSWNH